MPRGFVQPFVHDGVPTAEATAMVEKHAEAHATKEAKAEAREFEEVRRMRQPRPRHWVTRRPKPTRHKQRPRRNLRPGLKRNPKRRPREKRIQSSTCKSIQHRKRQRPTCR